MWQPPQRCPGGGQGKRLLRSVVGTSVRRPLHSKVSQDTSVGFFPGCLAIGSPCCWTRARLLLSTCELGQTMDTGGHLPSLDHPDFYFFLARVLSFSALPCRDPQGEERGRTTMISACPTARPPSPSICGVRGLKGVVSIGPPRAQVCSPPLLHPTIGQLTVRDLRIQGSLLPEVQVLATVGVCWTPLGPETSFSRQSHPLRTKSQSRFKTMLSSPRRERIQRPFCCLPSSSQYAVGCASSTGLHGFACRPSPLAARSHIFQAESTRSTRRRPACIEPSPLSLDVCRDDTQLNLIFLKTSTRKECRSSGPAQARLKRSRTAPTRRPPTATVTVDRTGT